MQRSGTGGGDIEGEWQEKNGLGLDGHSFGPRNPCFVARSTATGRQSEPSKSRGQSRDPSCPGLRLESLKQPHPYALNNM